MAWRASCSRPGSNTVHCVLQVNTTMPCPLYGTFAFGTMMPFAKAGFPLPLPSYPNRYRKPDRRNALRTGENSRPGFSPSNLRHNFVVKPLQKPGIFKPWPYIYMCLRCRYTFLVSERRGSIVALDRQGRPIPEPENSRRLATFTQGPCPAFKVAPRGSPRQTASLAKRRRHSLSGIFALLTRVCAKMRYPYSLEKNVPSPVGILPADLLS